MGTEWEGENYQYWMLAENLCMHHVEGVDEHRKNINGAVFKEFIYIVSREIRKTLLSLEIPSRVSDALRLLCS